MYSLENAMSQKLQFSPYISQSIFEEPTSYKIQTTSQAKKLRVKSIEPVLQPSFTFEDPFTLPNSILPQFARENPAGHSYLCRMEVHVERALPIPLWIRAGKVQDWEAYNSTAMYVQVKLLGFKR